MASTARIQELAGIISKNTTIIQAALVDDGLPTPSFEPNASVYFPPQVTSARDAVLDASQELHDLLLYPMSLLQRKSAHNQMAGMKAIIRWDIANCFAPGEQISFSDLSKKCGLDEKPLKHLLRQSMTLRIFSEPAKGMVAHTAASSIIRYQNVHNWLAGGVKDLWPSSVQIKASIRSVSCRAKPWYLVDALAKWPKSEEPNHTGFNIAHDTEVPLYQQLANNLGFAKRFGESMTAMIANNPAFDAKHIHQSYDWSGLKDGLVVDVGGGHGSIAFSLAQAFPSLRFIVQDLPTTVGGADALIPTNLSVRIKFMAHDFFTNQPVTADAYLFRWIFHNWSDKYGVLILQALVPALKPGARVLVQDGCLPEPGAIPQWIERDPRAMDLLMTTYFNSYERDAAEWQHLFARADSRFEFVGITQPQGSALALVEARWTGGEGDGKTQ
ncbi:hypothetical protein MMC18_000389 [Xylographa bjoerkii]|nr:hypothetical protein [Xylographa bjoerkii]